MPDTSAYRRRAKPSPVRFRLLPPLTAQGGYRERNPSGGGGEWNCVSLPKVLERYQTNSGKKLWDAKHEHHRCIKELKEFLLEACTEEATKKKMKTYLERHAGDVGLLVSQRFVNSPNQLVPPLYDALFDEIAWATEDEPTQELRDSFCFKYYVLATRIFEWPYVFVHASSRMISRMAHKPEDEIFQELSSLSFTFALCAVRPSPSEMKNYKEKGLVMVIDASQVSKFREKLKCLLAEC
ncbi:protein BCCIP homolog [Curcuma longa]|uniref:protein BCCIP homolog n=1 Tax=Curcuma longa TaxID=136217 RepID=UPI003D9DC337